MTEPVVVHRCPGCGRAFNVPTVCHGKTVAIPMVVSDDMFRRLQSMPSD